MYEKEVKIKVECNAIENLVRILEENGAKQVRVQDEVDVYYQHPCRNFLETDEAVRLRIVDGKTESITYKGQRIQESNGVKKRKEVILTIKTGDPDEFLRSLGFKPAVTVEKTRTYMEYQEHLITIDKVKHLGCFIEIEGENPDSIMETLQRFGLHGEIVEETYAEMILKLKGLEM